MQKNLDLIKHILIIEKAILKSLFTLYLKNCRLEVLPITLAPRMNPRVVENQHFPLEQFLFFTFAFSFVLAFDIFLGFWFSLLPIYL